MHPHVSRLNIVLHDYPTISDSTNVIVKPHFLVAVPKFWLSWLPSSHHLQPAGAAVSAPASAVGAAWVQWIGLRDHHWEHLHQKAMGFHCQHVPMFPYKPMMQQFNLNVLWPILAPFVSSVCRLYT
jgi:hypothetical protein